MRIEIDDLRATVAQDVLKRDVIEGEQAEQARKKLSRAANRMLRIRKQGEDDPEPDSATESQPPPAT